MSGDKIFTSKWEIFNHATPFEIIQITIQEAIWLMIASLKNKEKKIIKIKPEDNTSHQHWNQRHE